MDKISKRDIGRLRKTQKQYVISIYLPTIKVAGRETRQNLIRFRNLIKQARQQLEAVGVRETIIKKQLDLAHNLIIDDDFWRHQEQGLAVFISPTKIKTFRLSYESEEMVTVAMRYQIKQLLPALNDNKNYFVLKFSPNLIELFEATRGGIETVKDIRLPSNITEALGKDDNERQTQHHFGDSTPAGAEGTIFHGHGGAKDLADIDQQRFVRLIAKSVAKYLKNQPTPLVLASVDEMFSVFKEMYPGNNLHYEYLSGNHDATSPEDLHAQTLTMLKPLFEAEKTDALERFRSMQSAGSTQLLKGMDEIISHISQGRVETLLINKHSKCWGIAENGQVSQHKHRQRPGLLDLSDIAASEALDNGSNVYLVDSKELDADLQAVAILRY